MLITLLPSVVQLISVHSFSIIREGEIICVFGMRLTIIHCLLIYNKHFLPLMLEMENLVPRVDVSHTFMPRSMCGRYLPQS